ncbi:MAG: ferritin [Deferribacteres bacterium]|nr:ferritin [candidate division KSB1 bacterium]MCB9503987.1 ferritin [Deferribacteres bacterium]
MLSEKMTQALNEQLTFELFSGHLYLSMAAFCASKDLDGFANFFIIQEQEERFHAMKFFHYVNEKGGDVKIYALEQPETEFAGIEEIFTKSLHHERIVTSRINDLMTLAREENDYATQDFLQWFVREQVEEESTLDSLLKKLQLIKGEGQGLLMLDEKLAARQFTAPAVEE